MHKLAHSRAFTALLFALLGLALGQPSTALAQDETPPQAIQVETIDCPMTLPEGDVDGETIVCGQIEVPEEWGDPDSTLITITYAVAKSESRAPFKDPVIYFDGGPGFSSLEAIEKLSEAFSHLRRTRDIIFFDQRGTSYSANLDCPTEVQNPAVLEATTPVTPTQPLTLEELQARLAALPPPPTVNDDPEALVEKAREDGPPESNARCAAYFENEGVSLEAYNTANSVRDVVALLGALDYPEYNLYAISYGTTVALELLRYYDEHPDLALPVLRSAVIDGAYPSYVDSFEHALMFPDVILDVFAACVADDACAEAYPDIRQRAIDFMAALEEAPIQVDEDTEIEVFDFVGVLESAVSNEDTRALAYLPRLIDEMERGEFETFLGLAGGQGSAGSLPPAEVETAPEDGDLFDPIAGEVQDLAAQARQLVAEIEAIAEHSRRISATLGQGVSPAELFAEEFASSTENLPHYQADSVYNSAERLTFQAPTLETIEQLAGLAPAEEQAFLQSIINLMDEDDILQTFALLRQPSYLGRLQRANLITNRVVECNDRYANFDLPATFETLRAYDAPQLILDPTSSLSYQIDCEGYGLTSDPALLPDPVTSSVRTLVSNGALDVNTRVAWGSVVFDSLTNAEMVTFPNSGHASTMLSQCAKDVTNFFITYPEAELNLACIEDMKPDFVLPNEGAPAGDLPADVVAQLDAYLQSQVWSEGGDPEGAAPGLVLLADTPEGRYLSAAGVSSLEDMTPMQADDVLEIGSNTKSMTVVLLMQLQEEGVLSMDDMLSDWLPDLAAQIPNGEQITLRQMAQHTAGLWDYGDPIIGEAAVDPDKLEVGYTPEELVQYAIDNGTPDFAPGEEDMWKYSNTGYVLLGMIAEKAAGQSLGELYQERIFDPLGLETAVLIEGVPQEGEITTQGYWWLDDGSRLNTTNWNASQGWAAGAVAMSAEDLAAYGKALAAGELFQNEDSLAQMLDFDQDALNAVGGPYGLGLIDYGSGYWGHEGQTAGFQTLWYTNPDEQITVVGLTNSAAYPGFAFLNVLDILEGEGAKPFQPRTLLPVGLASMWEWVQLVEPSGTSDIEPGTVLALAKDGTAFAKGEGCGLALGSYQLAASGQISFELDPALLTCDDQAPVTQLVDLLGSTGTWRLDNGRLVIVLDDGRSLLFNVAN